MAFRFNDYQSIKDFINLAEYDKELMLRILFIYLFIFNHCLLLQGDTGLPGTPGLPVSSHFFIYISLCHLCMCVCVQIKW